MLRSSLVSRGPRALCGLGVCASAQLPLVASGVTSRVPHAPAAQGPLVMARRFASVGGPTCLYRMPIINGNYIKRTEPFETKIEIKDPEQDPAAATEAPEVEPGTIVQDTAPETEAASRAAGAQVDSTAAPTGEPSAPTASTTAAGRPAHKPMSEKVADSHCFTCSSETQMEQARSAAAATAAQQKDKAANKAATPPSGAPEPAIAAAAAATAKTADAPEHHGPARVAATPKTAPKPQVATIEAPADPAAAAAPVLTPKVTVTPAIKPRADGVVISENISDIPVRRVLEKVWEHLWPKHQPMIRFLVVSSVVCVLLAKVLKVAMPFWFKSVIDVLSAGTTAATATATLGPFTLGAFGLVSAYGICRLSAVVIEELKTVLFAPVGGHSSTELAMQMVDKLHRLDLSFHLNRETGVLSKDLDRGSRAFWTLAYSLLFMVVPTAFEMGLVCTALNTQAGPQFITIAIVAVVAYVAWTLMITNWRAKFRTRYNALDSRVGGLIVDSLLNFETVKYFGSEKYESARIRKETTNMNHQLVILDQTVAVLNLGQQLIFVCAAVLSLYLATCGVLAGAMTVGDLVLVDALLMQLYMPLSYLGMIYREMQTSTQNMQAMIALLDQQSAVNDAPDAKPYVYKDGTIELRDVTFEYRKELDRVVLKNLSLTIPGGHTVAFVGPSGSGKSTIFRLLFRFFDPTSGTVLIDGQPLKSLQLSTLRDQVGVIPQDTVLFNESVMYNIRYSKLDATDEEVMAAAKKASLHDAVMKMENGYDTAVGERGLKLSGGEKQRVAIARVVLDDPPIILADEATSALDSTTELNVMETLRNSDDRAKPRTTILIAHRLTTVKQADIIFVLDGKGGLAEQGSHAELLAAQGLYAQLWNQQLRDHRRATAEKAEESKKKEQDKESTDGTVKPAQ